ncbi:BglG family transcription antiterminator [Listeria rustica]|uniref:Ascorbate-specific PTS system EIIA component n=1 Tax=Listeria rustica TaxID=2713503 RepID=A0A7W1YFY8_9LIST|nr:BglG family transcription antiterminator [Listeria rustica]MBA3926205.1 BglG family transcription antiterminator [Listeria rustica]
MYLDERSNVLLKEILRHPNISNAKLQEKFGLTRRQVDYSFQKVNQWLEEQAYPKIHRSANGRFVVEPDLFQLVEGTANGEEEDRYILSEKERASLIILMLSTSQEELSLNHFISELEVSKNTVLRDLKGVQAIFDTFGLEVHYSRMNGYQVCGDEWNQRSALIYAAGHIISSYNGEQLLRHFMQIETARVEQIRDHLVAVEVQLNLTFIDNKMQILPYILESIFRRIRKGQRITTEFLIDFNELSDTQEYGAAKLLIEDEPYISETERLYISLQLLTSNVLPKNDLTNETSPRLKMAVAQVLSEFEKKACIQFVDKDSLLEKLFAHIKPAYYRIKYHLTTDYSLLDKIDQEFEAVHYIVKQSLKPLEKFIGTRIPENESIFITLFIGGHLIDTTERLQTRLKAVVVCPNGLSISRLMEKTLRSLFPEIFFYQAMSIREFERTNVRYDLIFSAVPLQSDKKIFLINQLMDEQERLELRRRVMRTVYMVGESGVSVEQLMRAVEKYADVQDKERLARALAECLTQPMNMTENLIDEKKQLIDLLQPEMIQRTKRVKDWQTAIQMASEPLLEKGAITEAYVDEMMRQHVTPAAHIVLRQTIAIPHAETEKGVKELGMSMLYIEEGLALESGGTLHFVVVIAAIDKNAHFQALLQLMELAGHKKTLKKIAQLEEPQIIHQTIQKFIVELEGKAK